MESEELQVELGQRQGPRAAEGARGHRTLALVVAAPKQLLVGVERHGADLEHLALTLAESVQENLPR